MTSDFYREETSQASHCQARIDRTTNWAVTVMTGFLTVVFFSPNVAAYVLLIGIIALCGFLLFETRRYRFYDAPRAEPGCSSKTSIRTRFGRPEPNTRTDGKG